MGWVVPFPAKRQGQKNPSAIVLLKDSHHDAVLLGVGGFLSLGRVDNKVGDSPGTAWC